MPAERRRHHAPLHIAQRLKILVDLAAISAAEPASQPPDIVQHGIENAAVILTQGATPHAMPPAQFDAFIKNEVTRLAKVVKASGARAD